MYVILNSIGGLEQAAWRMYPRFARSRGLRAKGFFGGGVSFRLQHVYMQDKTFGLYGALSSI